MISEGVLVFNEYLENVLIKRKRLHDYLKTITSDTIDDELINSLKPKQKVNRIGY